MEVSYWTVQCTWYLADTQTPYGPILRFALSAPQVLLNRLWMCQWFPARGTARDGKSCRQQISLIQLPLSRFSPHSRTVQIRVVGSAPAMLQIATATPNYPSNQPS